MTWLEEHCYVTETLLDQELEIPVEVLIHF